ncbi:hypothetical protein B0T25DRAFT_571226 [Lasiosphaeria hispida]|uniref:Uncharacterized protein n=1 Tax=Lasiosphaeria hispida TaxID=260671 RepID=A0AAJ0HB51_9PEZI|nr:hypothetical protein B0T25DRAFT_571226 [Lasiosphaeria hispida]
MADQVVDQVVELVDLDPEAGGQQAAGLVERQPAHQQTMTYEIDHRGIQARFFTPGTPLINWGSVLILIFIFATIILVVWFLSALKA